MTTQPGRTGAHVATDRCLRVAHARGFACMPAGARCDELPAGALPGGAFLEGHTEVVDEVFAPFDEHGASLARAADGVGTPSHIPEAENHLRIPCAATRTC